MRVAGVNDLICVAVILVNGLFFMSEPIIQSIETPIVSFLSRFTFARLGIFAHLKRLYCINAKFP